MRLTKSAESTEARRDGVLERVTRLETRMTSFMVWSGFDPHRNLSKNQGSYSAPQVVDGAIHVATPSTTVGDILMAALKHQLTGDVDVCVAGRKTLTIDMENL